MPRGGKTERGRKTKASIVAAATRLFIERGYLETTMAAIAAEAGVAVQTLYLAFGSKVAILAAAHDLAVVGDDEPIPVLDRPWVDEVRAEPNVSRALELVLTNTLGIVERVAPISGVIQAAAADTEVAELLARTNAQRLDTMRFLAAELATKPGFVSALSVDKVADVLYAVVSNELHRLLVVERQWPVEDWRAWAHQSAAFRLLPDANHGDNGKQAPAGRRPASR